MSSFCESRCGKRQFDCSEAEERAERAERQLPFIDQSPAPRQSPEERSVALPGAPGGPAACPRGSAHSAEACNAWVLGSGPLPPFLSQPFVFCYLFPSW